MAPPTLKKRMLGNSLNTEDNSREVVFSTDDAPTESSDEDNCTQAEHLQSRHRNSKSYSRALPTEKTMSFLGAEYHSNIFKLQTEELLANVRPNYKRSMANLDNALRKLKNIIEQIPSRDPIPAVDAERRHRKSFNSSIPFPEPQPNNDAKFAVAYSKPANINIIGSYSRKTAIQIKDQFGVDLAVTMPSSLFQDKDYLNLRYFHKRAYYLACIAAGIEAAKGCDFRIEYGHQNGNHLQPIIIINSSQVGSEFEFSNAKCCIRILLGAETNLFPIDKTLPHQNCIRANGTRDTPQKILPTSTPFYNASLRSECCSLSYLKFLHSASLQSDGFSDSCVLGSVWLRQRGLGTELYNGGFGPFEWACTTAFLLQSGGPKDRPVLSRTYSHYQLFKATLQYLALKDLVQNPASIGYDGKHFGKHDGPILFDSARGMNILFKMTPWSYATLRLEAGRTLKLLKDPLTDQFDACFVTRIDDPLQRFDRLISLSLDVVRRPTAKNVDAIDEIMMMSTQIHRVLKTGLGERATHVDLKLPSKLKWSISTPKSPDEKSCSILIGLLLNPEHVIRSVDRGPSAEDKEEASAFRRFWGEKAELRRYQDGSIRESLVWSTSNPNHSILAQVIEYVAHRHLGGEAVDGLRLMGDSLDQKLTSQYMLTDPLALYRPTMTAYEDLEKQIRALERMPLQIRQIFAADPQLRYASLKVPALDSSRFQMAPANICVQFEGSARWPDDLIAVQRTKIAFLVKLGELLQESSSGLVARLGLEHIDKSIHNVAFLDLLHPSGAFFRLRIHHERELSLLERALKITSSCAVSTEDTATALSAYKRTFVQSAFHTQAVRTLSTRFPLLSPSMRLVKQWRDCHLLSDHVSNELIELLTIRIFVHPYPWSVPGSVMVGFLRTLTFLSKWNWHSEPLIVDLNGEMTSTDIDAINLRFEAWRKIDPAMNRTAIFAASNLDPHGITWTGLGPSKVVAARLTSLAKAACALAKEQGTSLEPEALFVPNMGDYDFLIHLSSPFAVDSLRRERQQSSFKNLRAHDGEDKSLAGFYPVQSFLEELRIVYGSNVVFFHNAHEGSIIAGLWNPQTGQRPWKINVGYSTMPVKMTGNEDAKISINKAATLHDIARLGGDMISKIEVNI